MFKVSLHDARTLKWWYSRRREIDFEPLYQRKGGLWSQMDKAYLIDSILNAYDIPKIYLADFTILNTSLNRRRLPYAIIDGRQRFEAIFGFFEDLFPLNPGFELDANPKLRLDGLTYSDLKANYPEVASAFEEANLQVMSVITDEEAKINELFVRLNRSKPLTGAEIRNAMQGKVPELVRQIAAHSFFKECIRFSTKRGQDKNTAAKLLLIEFRGKFVDTKKKPLDRFVEEGLKSESDELSFAKERLDKVLDDMVKVFRPADKLLSSQGPVPVYYWLVRENGGAQDLREFLVNFERGRRDNAERANQGATDVNAELLSYNLLDRSTSDERSLQGRFRILNSSFLQFRASRSQT